VLRQGDDLPTGLGLGAQLEDGALCLQPDRGRVDLNYPSVQIDDVAADGERFTDAHANAVEELDQIGDVHLPGLFVCGDLRQHGVLFVHGERPWTCPLALRDPRGLAHRVRGQGAMAHNHPE
jgi:hypothetical protein